MQKILSLLRRCVEDYDMIAPGERVAVGVSGGKDSLVLLAALARLATVLSWGLFRGGLYGGHGDRRAWTCLLWRTTAGSWASPSTGFPPRSYHVIFETRREKNPCALCAKMRRGSLHTALLERGHSQGRPGPPL